MDSTGGHIELIMGPMFSGKSTELQRRIKRHIIAKRDCIVVKYHKDTRYSMDEMATHDKQCLKATAAAALEDVYESLLTHDVIGIDEGQFFPDVNFLRASRKQHVPNRSWRYRINWRKKARL